VRELKSVVERTLLRAPGERIERFEIACSAPCHEAFPRAGCAESVRALLENRGGLAAAAAALGVSPRTLQRRLRAGGLTVRTLRRGLAAGLGLGALGFPSRDASGIMPTE
jgi:transcriptional regulator of acetoin/glycerol metabolism